MLDFIIFSQVMLYFCLRDISLSCDKKERDSFISLPRRRLPFLVKADNDSPSQTNPRNFKGLSHLPSYFTHPDLFSWRCIPHSGKSLTSKGSLEKNRPSSAYETLTCCERKCFIGIRERRGPVLEP